MIDKRDVQAFFDRLAPDWDADMVRNEAVIARILDNAGVCDGCTVLDVACGTGVLFGDYVKRGAARVTAVDLSPEMAARAAEKAAGTQITVVCGDVEDSAAVRDSGPYDVVMVYNAFPHFPDPAGLIRTLAELVRPGGRLSIAHGMSRAALAGAIARELLGLCPAFDSLDEYRARCFVPGHWVTVCTGAETYAAKALFIDDAGRLVVEREGGRQIALQHGEVSIRPTSTI